MARLVRREPPAADAGDAAPGALEGLGGLSGRAFEDRFLGLMIRYHRGAVLIAGDARRQGGGPRLRLFADHVGTAQRGQIERMAGLRGAVPTAAGRRAVRGGAGRPGARQRVRHQDAAVLQGGSLIGWDSQSQRPLLPYCKLTASYAVIRDQFPQYADSPRSTVRLQ